MINPENTGRGPPDSFIPKVLSAMMIRMFQTLSVPEDIVQNYTKRSIRRTGLKKAPHHSIVHAFLHFLVRLAIVDDLPALSELATQKPQSKS